MLRDFGECVDASEERQIVRRDPPQHEASRLQPVCAVRQGHCEDAFMSLALYSFRENVSTAPSSIVAPRIAGREAAIVHAKSCVNATGATMLTTLKSDAAAPCRRPC